MAGLLHLAQEIERHWIDGLVTQQMNGLLADCTQHLLATLDVRDADVQRRAILFSATPHSMAREIMKCSCTIESRIAFFVCIGFAVERQQAFDLYLAPASRISLLRAPSSSSYRPCGSGLWKTTGGLMIPTSSIEAAITLYL